MTSNGKNLVDPAICSCFLRSYRHTVFNKVQWSTLSIGAALLIIIVYLSSGLHALIDVTTMTSGQSYHNGGVFWEIASSSFMTIFGWILVLIYFTVVLLIIVLLCGIQLEKPWLLFTWSILMVFMLLADGIVTVLSLREHQQQNYRPLKQIKILFVLMNIRLIVSICGIFVTVFHFRRMNRAQSDQINRQRMLDRYHTESSTSSYHDSSERSGAALDPSKDNSGDHYMAELLPPGPLPRAKVATTQQHPTSTLFDAYNHQTEYNLHSYHRAVNKYNTDFRYNVPLQERFHEREISDLQNY